MGMSGGVSADDYTKGGTDLSNADLVTSFLEFEDAETVDVSLILGGVSDATAQKILIDMCDKRKDCIAFLSPVESSSVPAGLVQNKTAGEAATTVRDWRNNTLNKSSSYAVLDSGFKVMLDRYNDVLRYVPLNGDIAGLCARTEVEQEAWFSPAGFNRGQIRGVVKLAFEPRKAHRDELYKAGVNPVVSFPGEGTVLFGDKTMQAKPSAFDRINVRRLFIVLEKAIATASKYLLFEFNDEFTRAQFRNMVIPFLRTIMSRRGIYDFKVVCDETNNTGEVIDRNEFVGDIYIKPARSINFIQLNFIATKTGVDFSEVGG
jgi:phage tail sheath protein FI